MTIGRPETGAGQVTIDGWQTGDRRPFDFAVRELDERQGRPETGAGQMTIDG
ncbi:MAG: hypothetical protein MUD01_08205 [Chloroflexaceae bacterium]|nr:hypothetical protein [Chloroflexaceae bacterium]